MSCLQDLRTLRERMEKADRELLGMAADASRTADTTQRLTAKAEGVRLGLSYLNELIRDYEARGWT